LEPSSCDCHSLLPYVARFCTSSNPSRMVSASLDFHPSTHPRVCNRLPHHLDCSLQERIQKGCTHQSTIVSKTLIYKKPTHKTEWVFAYNFCFSSNKRFMACIGVILYTSTFASSVRTGFSSFSSKSDICSLTVFCLVGIGLS